MADFAETVSDSVAASDSALVASDVLRLVADSVAIADVTATASDVLRLVADSVAIADVATAGFVVTNETSDSVAIADATLSALDALRLVTDSVAVADALVAQYATEFSMSLADAVLVSDALTQELSRTSITSDSVTISDSVLCALSFERKPSDAIIASDALVSTATTLFGIDLARALTESRVRIDFEAPALINAALRSPASYTFRNLSLGSIEVTPLVVQLPPGQPNPLYVEVDTTEHTDALTYDVALSSAIRGAGGEFGNGVPYAYAGVGVAPQLQLVVAVSATEVEVHFSEALANNLDVNVPSRYLWTGGLNTIAVRAVIGNVVHLQTSQQTPGQLYTLTVHSEPPVELIVNDDADVDDGDFVLVELINLNKFVNDAVDVDDTIVAYLAPVALVMVVGRASLPGDSVQIQSSRNGINWAIETIPYPGPFSTLYSAGVSYNDYPNFKNFAIGADNSNGLIYSSDGTGSWTLATLPSIGGHLAGFAQGVGRLVIGGVNSFYFSSDNGVTWTQTPHGAGSPATSYYWSITYGNGLFVAVGGNDASVQTSPDGATWTHRPTAGGFYGSWLGVAYYGFPLNMFVIGGGLSGSADNLQTSPDGIVWTVRTPGGGWTGQIMDVAMNATSMVFVGLSTGGVPEIQSSFDGASWVHRNHDPPFAGSFRGVSWVSDVALWIACGSQSEIQTSPDAITWTHRAEGGTSDANFYGVVGL